MIHAAPIPPITALLLLISQVGLTKQNKTAALEEFSVLLIRIFTLQKQVNCDGKGGCLRNIYQGLRFVSGEECCVTIQRTTAKEAYRVLPRQMYPPPSPLSIAFHAGFKINFPFHTRNSQRYLCPAN